MAPSVFSVKSLLRGFVVFLVGSAAYLYAYPQANVFYAVVVLLHAVGGVLAGILLVPMLWRLVRERCFALVAGWGLLGAGAVVGCLLLYTGTPRSEWNLLYAHILLSLLAVAVLLAIWLGRRGWLGSSWAGSLARLAICLIIFAGLAAGARHLRETRWLNRARIENPRMPPAEMNNEGDGPQGPFFPSSAQVFGGQKIPSKFFMESDSCKRCHQDIYEQWNRSVHHFSSFNNQWYRKSIEYMQDTVGTSPSKWCG